MTEQNPAGGENSQGASPDVSGAPVQRGLMSRLRAYFLAGVLVTAPLGITVYLGVVFIAFIDNSVVPLIPQSYLPYRIPGLGLIILAIALTLIGALTAGLFGRWLVRTGERILNRMPVVRSVYGAIKQIFETVLAQKSHAFREAVLVEFPRQRAWSVGFITAQTKGEVGRLLPIDDVVTVYVPTTPNVTGGYMIFVPRSDVIPLNMSVEDAWKLVISVGIVTPTDRFSHLARAQKPDGGVTLEEVE
jgi:uncharacterized membrane protein